MMQERNTILAAGLCQEDQCTLREVLKPWDWALAATSTIAEAMRFLKRNSAAVILCERELPDGNWRDLLKAAAARERPPKVIVTSRLADEHLWAEVLNLGGYDVLAEPLDGCEVLHALKSAWRNWQYDAPSAQNELAA